MEVESVEELVVRAKEKDESAFDELILLIQKEMYLIARTKLKNEDDVADAIQETILLAYKNLRKLRDDKYFKTWIIKILINECNKIYNRKKKNNISFEEKEVENFLKVEDISYDSIGFDIFIKDLKEDIEMARSNSDMMFEVQLCEMAPSGLLVKKAEEAE